jgi:outer membrane protein assembly factor BamB
MSGIRIYKAVKYLPVILCLAFCNGLAEDWPCWRGPHGNGHSHEKAWNPSALTENARILWRTNVGPGYSAVSVSNNRIVTMGSKRRRGHVVCLNAGTGKRLWRTDYEYRHFDYAGPRATPLIDETHVYALTEGGHLICLELETGTLVWSRNLVQDGSYLPGHGFSGSPILVGEKLILNACRHGMAVNKRTGYILWKSPPGTGGYAAPVFYTKGNQNCVAIFAQKHVVGVDADTGDRLWKYQWDHHQFDCVNIMDPIVSQDKIFVSTNYGHGSALLNISEKEPRQIWWTTELGIDFSSPIFLKGLLFASHGETRLPGGCLKCLDFKTGEILWTEDTDHTSMIAVDEKLILLNQWGELTIMDADRKGCRISSKARVMKASRNNRFWTPPSFCDGRLFLRSMKGDILCVDLSE